MTLLRGRTYPPAATSTISTLYQRGIGMTTYLRRNSRNLSNLLPRYNISNARKRPILDITRGLSPVARNIKLKRDPRYPNLQPLCRYQKNRGNRLSSLMRSIIKSYSRNKTQMRNPDISSRSVKVRAVPQLRTRKMYSQV